MKSLIKLAEFLPHLPAELQEGIDTLLKTAETEAELHRRVNFDALTPLKDRTFLGYASTRTLDRDFEVVMPHGMDLSQFRKAPVLLWGHKWSEPPIGKDETIESDGYGLKTKSKMSTTPLAEDLWTLVKEDMLKTSSIGFIPLEYKSPGDKDWGKLMDELNKWPEFDKSAEIRGVCVRSLLLEHSLVSVPANTDSLISAIAAKHLKADTLMKELRPTNGQIQDIFKGAPPAPPAPPTIVTPFHKLVKSPEQIRLELELEVQAAVAREIKLRMGRI